MVSSLTRLCVSNAIGDVGQWTTILTATRSCGLRMEGQRLRPFASSRHICRLKKKRPAWTLVKHSTLMVCWGRRRRPARTVAPTGCVGNRDFGNERYGHDATEAHRLAGALGPHHGG
jgi:hypothetical protein